MDAHPLRSADAGSDAYAELPTVPTDAELLAAIGAFLGRHPEITRTRFGLDAMGEGNLIKSLEGGRSLSLKNTNRVITFMTEYDERNTPDGAVQSATKADQIIRDAGAGEADSPRPFAPSSPTSSPTIAPSQSSPDSQACSVDGEAEAA